MDGAKSIMDVLPPEAIVEIVNHLDLPSRLSLALACQTLYDSHWPGHNPKYFPYDVLDACADLGYFGLLQYAYAHGAFLDLTLLCRAISSSDVDLVRWMLPLVPLRDPLPALNAAFIAGNLEIISMFPEHEELSGSLFYSAARGGQVQLALQWWTRYQSLNRYSAVDLSPRSVALMYGKFKAAKDLSTLEGVSPKKEPKRWIVSALAHSNRDWLLKHLKWIPAVLEEEHLADHISPDSSIEMLELLLEHFPIFSVKDIFRSVAKRPTLRRLEFLVGRGLDFSKDVVATQLLERPKELFLGELIKPSLERFDCIQFAFEKGLRWRALHLPGALTWATPIQFQWMLDRSPDAELLDASRFLRELYGNIHSIQDEIVLLLISMFKVDFSRPGFALDLLMRVDLSLLKAIALTKFKERLLEGLQSAVESLGSYYRSAEVGEKDGDGNRARKRYHHWLRTLRWLRENGIEFSESTSNVFRSVENLYFRREFQKLLTES